MSVQKKCASIFLRYFGYYNELFKKKLVLNLQSFFIEIEDFIHF